MRTRLAPIAALAAAFLAAAGYAQDKPRPPEKPLGPRIAWRETEHLFPRTIQGQKVTHLFAFKNAGDAELVIRKVETTCGCTLGRITKDHLAPGEEAGIELVLDTTDRISATLVRATVYSNDPSQQAAGPCTTLLELKGEIATCFKLLPTGAWFGQVVRKRSPLLREVKCVGVLDAAEGFQVTAIEVPVDWIRVEQRKLDRSEIAVADKVGYGFKVTLLPHLPPGEFLQHVVVRTDTKAQPSFRFAVVGVASGPIRGPEVVTFDRVRRGQEVERISALEHVEGSIGPVRVLRIDYDASLLDVSTSVVVDGARLDVHQKLRKDVRPGPFATQVVVHVDDPEAPLVRWPVFGNVLPRVVADPPAVLLEAQKPALVSVTLDGGKLLSAHARPEDAFDVKTEPGERPRVLLSPRRALAPGERASLELATDVPGEEALIVPIEERPAPPRSGG